MGYYDEDHDICGPDRNHNMGTDPMIDGTYDVGVILKDGDFNGKFLKFVMNDGSSVDEVVGMVDREFPGYRLVSVRMVFEDDCE